jgi:hypothetical protein
MWQLKISGKNSQEVLKRLQPSYFDLKHWKTENCFTHTILLSSRGDVARELAALCRKEELSVEVSWIQRW